MKEIKEHLQAICQAFKLGKLLNWHSTTEIIAGFQTVYFDTEKEKNLKYHFKLKEANKN